MTDEIRSASNFKTFIKQIRNRIFEVYIVYLVYFNFNHGKLAVHSTLELEPVHYPVNE